MRWLPSVEDLYVYLTKKVALSKLKKKRCNATTQNPVTQVHLGKLRTCETITAFQRFGGKPSPPFRTGACYDRIPFLAKIVSKMAGLLNPLGAPKSLPILSSSKIVFKKKAFRW